MSFSKKIIIIFTIIMLVGMYIVPAIVFAAETKSAEPPTDCWPQDMCTEKGGYWPKDKEVSAYQKKHCTPFEDNETRYCYAPPPTVDLQISIGGTKQVKGLLDYIPRIYNYLVAIVSIVAIVMIMVGGLQYLTAGGSPEKVSQAKDRILGAVIGLFLVLGAYTLLNTINPNLTKLKLPPIKMIRADVLKKTQLSGQECWTESDKATCEASCKGCKCRPICETNTEKISKYGMTIATMMLPTGGISGVATLGQGLVKSGLKLSRALARWILKSPTIKGKLIKGSTLGAGAGLFIAWKVGGKGERGFCYALEKGTLKEWDMCEENIECASGKCINASSWFLSGVGGCALYKLCSSGQLGSPCDHSNPGQVCLSPNKCLPSFLGGMGICGEENKRPLFSLCDNHNQCTTGYCNPTSKSCTATSGDTLKGSQCAGAYCKTSQELKNNNGICTSFSGITALTGISKEEQETINTSDLSYCSNKYKKCYNRISWLVCESKFSGGIYGKCLKATADCTNNQECVYACENGECSNWPPAECNGFTP